MNTTKLSDAALSQRIHELLGKRWHEFNGADYPQDYKCKKCNAKFVDEFGKWPYYANSYDAIIPVVQGMELSLLLKLNIKIKKMCDSDCCPLVPTDILAITCRKLAEAVAEVLGGGE